MFKAYSDTSRLMRSKAVIEVAHKELDSEMGIIYQQADLSCLAGLERPAGSQAQMTGTGFLIMYIYNQEEVQANHDIVIRPRN